ncbi:addiction module protein [Denitratimonas sp. CY0512]|uniref:addiction module protein n=1 Tax=Denitratimonas sp. CY0512 TaxID=3131940 RepID=UPI0030AF0064
MITIENLSRMEKLRMMEALWRDLSANANELASPAWHGEALQQAEAALAGGTARMVDWADAKEMLRKRDGS